MSQYPPDPLLRSFERYLRAANRSERTVGNYLESLHQAEAFLRPRGVRLREATRADLEDFLADLLARRAAAAAASSHAGPSIPDSLAPACRHQARHSSQAAIIQGVPNTAIQIAMSSRAWAVSGSSALCIIWAQRPAKGAAAPTNTASPPTRPMRWARFMCPPAAVAAPPRRQPGLPSLAPAARLPAPRPAPGRDRSAGRDGVAGGPPARRAPRWSPAARGRPAASGSGRPSLPCGEHDGTARSRTARWQADPP